MITLLSYQKHAYFSSKYIGEEDHNLMALNRKNNEETARRNALEKDFGILGDLI